MGRSERQKELARRRHRRAKIRQLQRRAESASQSEKAAIADKIRKLTPGSTAVIDKMGLEERS